MELLSQTLSLLLLLLVPRGLMERLMVGLRRKCHIHDHDAAHPSTVNYLSVRLQVALRRSLMLPILSDTFISLF